MKAINYSDIHSIGMIEIVMSTHKNKYMLPIFLMSVHPKRFDVGDILLQERVEIAPDAVATE